MQVAQRGTSVTGVTVNGYYTADRFTTVVGTLGTWTQTIENDAPTGSGFRKSFKILCTTADASPAAGDFFRINQAIEGQNVQQILKGTSSAKELTASFWVKSNVTGTYICDLYDNDNTRSVSKSYTISASGTWEKKTITFPADTTGVLDNDNAASLYLEFGLGYGSNFTSGTLQTSWGSFVAANYAVGQTNLAAATNNYWQITGVQLEVGSTATEFEFLPIDVELDRCKRYCQRYDAKENLPGVIALQGWYFDANSLRFPLLFEREMRAAPTLIYNGTANTDYIAYSNSGAGTGFTFTSERANARGIVLSANKTSHGFSNNTSATFGIATTSGFLIFSSEI
jgi:hypothetical protein